MNRQSQKAVIALLGLLIGLVVAYFQSRDEQHHPPLPGTHPQGGEVAGADPEANLMMGNPSGATPDAEQRDNFLMRKPYFALSYNNSKGTPNWVSWRLRTEDLGQAPRVEFFPDTTLPAPFKRVTPKDYTGSGFDRGHLCPHSDRARTPEMSTATFVMTNMMPQAPNCNQKAWADLEEYCRDHLVKKHQTLYIVAGPQGQGGDGKEGPAEVIGRDKVTVPAKCWKVVLAVADGTGTADDVAKVGPNTRLIAVVMPNDQSVGNGWAKYRTSVKAVETLTGYRFFDRVPAEVIDPLKDKVDREHIPASRHARED